MTTTAVTTATEAGMSQRLAALRGGRRIAIRCAADGQSTTSASSTAPKRLPANIVEPPQLPPPQSQSQQSTGWHLCFASGDVAEFLDTWRSYPGYRLHDGQWWHEITPELLGWMASRIERGLAQPTVNDDLAAAIDLFHRARDTTAFEPVNPPALWVPPGMGRDPPANWDGDSKAGQWRRYSTDRSQQVPVVTKFRKGDRVRSRNGQSIQTAAGDISGVLDVVEVGCSDLGVWVSLAREGRMLVQGVSAEILESDS